jgi:HEAT repeat protein
MIYEQTSDLAVLILRLLEEPYTNEWWDANHALARQGARIVPDLITVVEKGPPYALAAAARLLGGFGHRAQAAAPALLEHLDDADERVRSDVAHALAQINPKLKFAVPQLIERLQVEDSMAARRGLLRILANIGPSASASVPVLEEILADEYLFEDAVCALQNVTRGELPPADLLIARLRGTPTHVACAAARALGRCGPASEAARDALVAAAQGSDWTLEDEARKALRRLGYLGKEEEDLEEE